MNRLRSLRWSLWLARLGWLVMGALATLVVLLLLGGIRGKRLENWHRWSPSNEIRAGSNAPQSFEEYRARESRVFEEVQSHFTRDEIIEDEVSRFSSNSPLCSWGFEENRNRSFLFEPKNPQGGVLLLHGLSDSPYSLYPLARSLEAQGLIVLGLRLPGHGTTPAALLKVRMEDWQLAVRLAAREVVDRLNEDQSFTIVGYSNGAALALDYSLESLNDPQLTTPNRLIVVSPALVVTRAAAVANWISALRHLPGLEALGWNSVHPEFDPYKYNSFTLNAAAQIHRLTARVSERLNAFPSQEPIDPLPPVLAFQSLVDSTIPTVGTLERLLGAMENNGSRVVLFDINTSAQTRSVIAPEVEALRQRLLDRSTTSLTAVLVGNRSPETREIMTRTRHAGQNQIEENPTDLRWPEDLFSLSHVSLPFPPNDPIYGRGSDGQSLLPLGGLELRGERGALLIPSDLQLRLRYNPFFSLLESEVISFLELEPGWSEPKATLEP